MLNSPLFYPSVYMKPYGFHAAWNGLIESFFGVACRVVYVYVGIYIGVVAIYVS